MLWQFIAARLSWWSHVLHLASATATSIIFLRSSEQNNLSHPCWDFRHSQACLGKVTTSCERRAAVAEPLLLAASASSIGLHRVVGKWQPLLWPQIFLSFFFLLAYLLIYPLRASDSGISFRHSRRSCFQLSILKTVRQRQPGICWCCLVSVCGPGSFSDVFQHCSDIISYPSIVNDAIWHYMSEIILQLKLRKFMASKQGPMSEGTVAVSPGLVKRELICINVGLFGTIVSLK